MKFKIISIIALLQLSALDIYAQIIQYPEKYVIEIEAYLDSLDSEEFKGTLIVKNILNDNHFDGKEIGIYMFFTLNSHSETFILFFNGERIDIKKDYNPETILKQSFNFINTYQAQLSKYDKVGYYQRIIEAVNLNLNPPGMLPPPPKVNGG